MFIRGLIWRQLISNESHFQRLTRSLELESAAEIKQLNERRSRNSGGNAEKSGETLLDLAIDDHRSGLGGRTLLTLVKRNRTLRLPWNRLRVGSPVILSTQGQADDETFQGIVSARGASSIEVAIGYPPEGNRFRLDLSPDEITRRRQKAALRTVQESRGRLAQLRDILLGEREPRFDEETDLEFSASLNPSQQAAVRFALSAQDVAIIHGPPGTGKTTTVIELIVQSIARGEKVLACAPSNTAADNLLRQLAAAGQRVVRVGHPARVSRRLREYTLDMLVERHDFRSIINDMLREAEGLFRKIHRYTRAQPPPGAKQDMHREAKQLKEHARLLERQAVDNVLDQADVICATTTFDERLMGDRRFDLAVIDEACQSTEPGCWIPLLRADRIVLAGDHHQLPPTVISVEAIREGFDCSLLERLVELYGDKTTRALNIQYRMHHKIMQFSSNRFYDDKLLADDSVREHLLAHLPPVAEDILTSEPVLFIDTAGASYSEELEPNGESRCNPAEGHLVLHKIKQLQEAGLADEEIAIIAPYAAQVRWLREHCESRELEIDTVDGFQGREKEAILISLVRSNDKGEIGFLSDTRRMNVALTRARRKLIVIGDSSTLGGHDFYNALLEYFESIDAYHTVWEEDL